MAGGGFTDAGGKRAHLYEYKITGYFIFSCIVGAMGGSLFGYDLGVSGGVTSMDDFLKEFFPRVYANKHAHLQETDYCKYDDQILTLFTSSLYFAALVSTFFASSVTKNKGRKASIIVGSISFFMGGVINAAAVNIAMLLIGRILLGVGIGFGNQVCYDQSFHSMFSMHKLIKCPFPFNIKSTNPCGACQKCMFVSIIHYIQVILRFLSLLGDQLNSNLTLFKKLFRERYLDRKALNLD